MCCHWWRRDFLHYVSLTFKFGSENSNVIVMTTTFAVIIIYFLFYIASMILSNQTGSGSMITMLSNTQSYVVYSIYGILGLISMIILIFYRLKFLTNKNYNIKTPKFSVIENSGVIYII